MGVLVDGNRRWAREQGEHSPSLGHHAGAEKIIDLLSWCSEFGIPHTTIYLLSTDNISKRPGPELNELLEIILQLGERLAAMQRWRLQVVGDMDLLPEPAVARLRKVESKTAGLPAPHVNLAIAYGGRTEIAAAIRSIIRSHAERGAGIDELADLLTPELIAEHLYTGGQPDPDLLIRTSGEQRLSGFLLWQSANSEFYFAEALWPDFRKVDFLRALRAFQNRHRRFGG
ncbi:MAG: hypothetical protein RL198_488 [Actinomycetota bacterium]